MAKPRVIVHLAVSLNGLIDGFEPDLAAYYGLIPTWSEDLTLCGSETILAAAPDPDPPDVQPLADPEPGDARPLLAIVDSRGRVRSWGGLIAAGHWRAGIAFASATTPQEHLDYLDRLGVEAVIVGEERVDLETALAAIAERGIETVRIDAGPTLNGLALRAGVVDEVSLLVHPVVSHGGRAWVDRLDDSLRMRPLSSEERDGDLMWLRYSADGATGDAGLR